MKTSAVALAFSLLIASGMCAFKMDKIPAVSEQGTKGNRKLAKRNQFLWNPDDTASCTDGSQCDGWCKISKDPCMRAGPSAEGCVSGLNLCRCYTTAPKELCICRTGQTPVDACTRGGGPLDVGAKENFVSWCVWNCDPDPNASNTEEKDHGGNGLCDYTMDPCLSA